MKIHYPCLKATNLSNWISFTCRKFFGNRLFTGIFLSILSIQQVADAQIQSMLFEGITRNYEVHLPQDPQADMPLVILLHGWGGTIDIMKEFCPMHTYGDTAGYVTVLAQGTINAWNIGIEYCPIRGYLPTVNDVGFISALIDTVCDQYTIDRQRIYCAGYSTGGELAFRLAGQLGHRIAAIASVSGGMFDAADEWHPIKPMPVLEFHGTHDFYYQYNGPGTYNVYFEMCDEEWSIENSMKYWVEKNQCNPVADTIDMPDLVPEDQCTAQKISYRNGPGNTEVVHFKINNGGHSWPGSPAKYPFWELEGNRNMDVDASVEIWNFLKNYSNDLVNLAYVSTFETEPYSIQSTSDTIFLRSVVKNPENHPMSVYAVIHGKHSAYTDTIKLFDDGSHYEEGSLDNTWGNYRVTSGLPEDVYEVELVSYDSVHDLQYVFYQDADFIKIGPLVFDGFEDNPVFHPGDNHNVKLKLKNTGAEIAATNISASMTSLDALTTITAYQRKFDDILPGSSSSSNLGYSFGISNDLTAPAETSVAINIFCNDQLSWTDTVSIMILPVGIGENSSPNIRIYPNPVTDILNFELNSIDGNALLEIYDLTGNVICQKEFHTEMTQLTGQIDLSGYYEGIYLLRIHSTNSVCTSKIILKK